MKPPPLLLGAALAFWGWQSDFLIPGLVMALIVEGARFVRARWDLSDEDFSRVWTFCSLVFLAACVYAFTSNNGPANFGGWFKNPDLRNQGAAGLSTARTAASMFRWLPMIFFLFLAAQLYSTREKIPLTTISLILRRRWRKAKLAGKPPPPARDVDIGFPYLAGTLVAASVHQADDNSYFWGMAGLVAWALWPQRSRRFGLVIWFAALALALTLGYSGQRGFGMLQRYMIGLNAEWLARFMRRDFDPAESRTAFGKIGSIKTSGRIVIRIQPLNSSPVPAYLRESSYRLYKSAVWLAGSSKDDFQGVHEDPPDSGNWSVLPGKTNTRALNIACYLEGAKAGSASGLLPLPSGVGRLEKLHAYVLSYNSAGAVLAEGPGLVIFDAFYSPTSTLDSPPGTGSTNFIRGELLPVAPESAKTAFEAVSFRSITNQDLHVPERERPALDAIIDQLKLRGLPREEVLRQVSRFFANEFSYRTWQWPGRMPTNETFVSRFLLQSRAGHCEYFATATTLLLRRLNLPARYAVGFAVHETSGSGYVVRLRDAHAWCLVWNPRRQAWDDFDTTPASWFAEEKKLASMFQWLQDAWSRFAFEFAKLRWGQSNLRFYLLMGIVPGLAVLLYQIVFRRGRRRKKGGGKLPEIFNWPGLDSDFYQLENRLAQRGVPRAPGEPLSHWLGRVVTSPELTALRAPLQAILRLHYRYRFDPLGLSEADRAVLKRETKACLDTLAQSELVVGK